jgi:hypothetical protein
MNMCTSIEHVISYMCTKECYVLFLLKKGVCVYVFKKEKSETQIGNLNKRNILLQ